MITLILTLSVIAVPVVIAPFITTTQAGIVCAVSMLAVYALSACVAVRAMGEVDHVA